MWKVKIVYNKLWTRRYFFNLVKSKLRKNCFKHFASFIFVFCVYFWIGRFVKNLSVFFVHISRRRCSKSLRFVTALRLWQVQTIWTNKSCMDQSLTCNNRRFTDWFKKALYATSRSAINQQTQKAKLFRFVEAWKKCTLFRNNTYVSFLLIFELFCKMRRDSSLT
jgi:hypothetical protein